MCRITINCVQNLNKGKMETSSLKHDPDIHSLMVECATSTKVTCQTLFKERFWLPFCDLHDLIFRILDDDSIHKVAIAAPRGFGKTSISTIAYPAKRIMFREKKFIVPISATATKAVTDGENLKRELMHNRAIKQFFGPMKTTQFSKEQWVTETGTMVMPRGGGQQIRGILYDIHRPDLIIADDLEKPDEVQNDELREKLKTWWFTDVCNSINRARDDWKIIIVGTILHEDSLLVNLLEDPEWYSVRLSICDDNLKSNWPDFMSTEKVRALHADHVRRGALDEFYREFRNIPVSTEDAVFKSEYFKHYDEKDMKYVPTENVVIVDPAKTVKVQSAETAIVGVGLNLDNSGIFVRDVVHKKLYPEEIYDEAFAMMARLGANVLAVEVTSLNEFIKQPIMNEIQARGLPYGEPVWLHARAKKEERIKALAPFYRLGYMYHNIRCCGGLEGQLLSFPRARLWDIMDALAYIVELMHLGERYFAPANLKGDEDEYDVLEQEDMLMPKDYNMDNATLGWKVV